MASRDQEYVYVTEVPIREYLALLELDHALPLFILLPEVEDVLKGDKAA